MAYAPRATPSSRRSRVDGVKKVNAPPPAGDVDRLAHDVHAVLGLVVEDALEARFPFREAVLGVAHMRVQLAPHRQRLVHAQHGPGRVADGVEVLADADHVRRLELRLALES